MDEADALNQRKVLLGLWLGLILAVTGFLTPGLAATPTILPGTYVAKVKGANRFRFRITGYIPGRCGTHAGVYCFVALSYPTITHPCADGLHEQGVFAVPDGYVTAAGHFSYFQALDGDQQPLLSFVADFSGGAVTGTLRQKDVYDPGTGALIPCDSGTLHWTATRSLLPHAGRRGR